MAEVQKKIDPAILYAIIAGCVISFVSFGFSASFSVFLRPMSADLGWGREVFSLSLAIQALMWGVTQPLAGAYADKHGSTRVLAFGAIFAALGFAAPLWWPSHHQDRRPGNRPRGRRAFARRLTAPPKQRRCLWDPVPRRMPSPRPSSRLVAFPFSLGARSPRWRGARTSYSEDATRCRRTG